jgi:hypothetical protein
LLARSVSCGADVIWAYHLQQAVQDTGFCLTYLPHHLPADLSDFFDEMAGALQSDDIKRLEIIGFRGCAKSTKASLALVLWASLEHPEQYPWFCHPSRQGWLAG